MGLLYFAVIITTLISTISYYLKILSTSLLIVITVVFLTFIIKPVNGDNSIDIYQLNEEQIRYSFRKCQNESDADIFTISLWNKWEFPNNKKTHCYVKCFLYKLGLINLKHMGFDEHKFRSLLKKPKPLLNDYSMLNSEEKNYEELPTLDIFKSLDSTCQSYYEAWLLLIEHFGFNDVYNGFTMLEKKHISTSKALGQTALDFCNDILLNNFERKLKSSINSSSIKCLEECIYKYFHYIDAYGRVDVKEILQSFTEINQSSLQFLGSKIYYADSNKENIEKCAHFANQHYYEGLCIVSSKLNECLMENLSDYKKIFKYRDKMTAFY